MLRTMALYSVDGAYISLTMAWALLFLHLECAVRDWCCLGLWRGEGGVDMTLHWAGIHPAIMPTCPHQMPQREGKGSPWPLKHLPPLWYFGSTQWSPGSVCCLHSSRSWLLFPFSPQTVPHLLSSPAAQGRRIRSPTLPLPAPLLSRKLYARLIS